MGKAGMLFQGSFDHGDSMNARTGAALVACLLVAAVLIAAAFALEAFDLLWCFVGVFIGLASLLDHRIRNARANRQKLDWLDKVDRHED